MHPNRARMTQVAAACLSIACVWILALPTPASAHGQSSTYLTTVTGIKPALKGVSATARSDGASITITNSTDTPLVVLGYQGEPYVRVSSSGVWQNQNSPAVYLNKESFIDDIPKTANANAAPAWKRLSAATSFSWHDHRIHWMGGNVPPQVEQDPSHDHLIKTWTIPLRFGNDDAAVYGELTWRPGNRLGNLFVAGSLVILMAVLIAIVHSGGPRRPRGTTNLAPKPTAMVGR